MSAEKKKQSLKEAGLTKFLVDSTQEALTLGSTKKVKWQHPVVGLSPHVWEAAVKSVAPKLLDEKVPCPYCSNKTVLVGFNNVAYTNPEASACLLDEDDGDLYTAGSNEEVEWQHTVAGSPLHVWKATVKNFIGGFSPVKPPCPICDGSNVLIGFNNLRFTQPNVASFLKDPSVGDTVTAGSSEVVQWTHAVNSGPAHDWEAKVKSVVLLTATGSDGSLIPPCPFCANKRVLKGFNNLGHTKPHVCRFLVDKNNADLYTRGSSEKVTWKHRTDDGLDHEWVAAIKKVVNATSTDGKILPCPHCKTKGEYALSTALEALFKHRANVMTQANVTIGDRTLKVDVRISSTTVVVDVECDGPFHFQDEALWDSEQLNSNIRDNQVRDRLKDEDAVENGRSIVRVHWNSKLKELETFVDKAKSVVEAAWNGTTNGDVGLFIHTVDAGQYARSNIATADIALAVQRFQRNDVGAPPNVAK